MLIQIDPLSPDPIFEQVVFQVKTAVAEGTVRAGDQLPSVRELAKALSINPNTVARSYEALEREGVILRRQGRGCFVNGEATALRDEERERRLEHLLSKTVTEAFHLGFAEEEVRAALGKALDRIRFAGQPRTSQPRRKSSGEQA